MKKIVFHLGHPAQFHLFKYVIRNLKSEGHQCHILIKKKDVLEDLLRESGLDYINILPVGRKDSKFSAMWGLLKQMWAIYLYSRKVRPDILIGTSAAIGRVAKLLSTNSIVIGEDDAHVVPLLAKASYGPATELITPISCDNGKWEGKSTKYPGYHELAYLHPNNFQPNELIVKKYLSLDTPFFILRFAKLSAHHDSGIKGISNEIALELVKRLSPHGRVVITSERELNEELESYRLKINPADMHHVMSLSSIYIGDSQTMAVEAGVLGIPFIRVNDFVGKIGILNELELHYQLGYGIFPNETEKLYQKLDELLNMNDRHQIFQARKIRMLEDKIDVTKLLTWYLSKYPESGTILKKNKSIYSQFK